ncbi:MAG TPA: C25 family cysteine peptidase [Candidatus Thermoplasmatota archaeon]|nr:C25 family cysteine peptidase [Candidatus Thermoplasmatota archaeon]
MMRTHKKSFIRPALSIIMGIILLCSAFVTGVMSTQNNPSTKDIQVTVARADTSGVDFHVTLENYRFDTISNEEKTYDSVDILTSGQTSDYGKAQLPTISYYVAVPQAAEVSLSYETSNPITRQGYEIYPAQYPKPDGDGFKEPPFVKNESFYMINEYYPDSVIDISPIMMMRDCRMVLITIYPITYNPVQKTVKVYKDITINVDFSGGTGEFIPEKYRSIYFQPLFDAFVLNSNSLERPSMHNPEGGVRSSDRADLLIVVYDAFYDAILPLAEWRHLSGIETKVVKWSDIGTTAADFRTYTQDAYDNWDLPPSFILIVGDADHVPVNYLFANPYHGTPTATDLWYACIGTTDYLPEMHSARISVENSSQLTGVVNKILDYSKTPYMEENWFDDILLAAYQESGRYFIYGSERIYNFLTPLGYVCNRQYQGSTPPGSTQGVINAINNGVIIANHRDHGAAQNDGYSYTGWSYPQFTTTNIQDSIFNGRKYPIMYSLNCDSGWFDGETDSEPGNYESIGEIGLRVADRGFVAVLASTRVSYSGYNDEFCVGLYDAMWSNFDPNYPNGGSANPITTEVYRTAQVMNYGKFWMYDKYVVPGGCSPYPWTPSATVSRATFEEFHMHGDPTMEIWTEFPLEVNVTHPDSVPLQPSTLSITVTTAGNAPVAGAMVCVSQENGLYSKNVTDDTGTTELFIEPQSGEIITIVVTAHNYLSYIGTIHVWVSDPPATPKTPDGPTFGSANIQYTFSTDTTDPDGDQIYYCFDWGNGNLSDWVGPFASGASASASYIWMQGGNYTICCKAKDSNGAQSRWSDPISIHIGVPNVEIGKISGGIASINVEVKNTGEGDAFDIPWTVQIKRYPTSQYPANYNKAFNGTCSTILAGAAEKVACRFLFGLGGALITVHAYDKEKMVVGFVLGFIIIVPPQ